MKYASIRRVTQSTVDAHAALGLWSRRDANLEQKLAYAPLPPSDTLVVIHAYRQERCWSGFLDLAEWLECTAPELAGLAQQTGQRIPDYRQQLQKLFEASEQPLQLPLPELSYHCLRIDSNQKAEFDIRQCYLSIVTPQGRLWLTSFPVGEKPTRRSLSTASCLLPVTVELRLGSSTASRRLVADTCRGDVLLITTEDFLAYSADQAIGRFLINEDGEIAVQALNGNDEGINPHVNMTVEDIPVRLDYVLQRCTMTVAELDALYRGQFLQLDPQAEKQIEIMANGVRLAKGELVELNGRLGVELSEITIGKKIGEARRV